MFRIKLYRNIEKIKYYNIYIGTLFWFNKLYRHFLGNITLTQHI